MKLGFARGIEALSTVEKSGYDYIELSVGAIAELSDDEVKSLKETLDNSKVKCVSCNCLMSNKVPPLCFDGGMYRSRLYLEKVMKRLAYLGVKTVVFGSGKFRYMPEEAAPARQKELLRNFMVMLESIARENDILVVIEPLNASETNTILTTAEAMEYVKELDLPNLKLLVDLYHFYRENEPMERIYEYGKYIKHVHIAEPTKRDYMTKADEYDYAPFFKALCDIGYDGAVVFEGGRSDFDSGIASTYEVLKSF